VDPKLAGYALASGLAATAASLPTTARAQDRAACLASYDAGQAARDEQKLTKARREFAVCASASCPAVLRTDCIAWLREADAVMPTVVLRATDDGGRDRTDVEVDLDGVPFVHTLDGTAIGVDPGLHVFRLRAARAAPVEERVVVARGEKNRVVVVHVPGAAGQPAPARETPRSPTAVLPAVLAGIAVLALGGATYFYAKGIHDGDALRDRCGSPPSCPRADVDAVQAKLVTGDVMASVGLLAAGAAIYFVLTRSASTMPARATADGLLLRF
jgi:hypothetical protein